MHDLGASAGDSVN